jgi:CRP-like cAMP-binding protein
METQHSVAFIQASQSPLTPMIRKLKLWGKLSSEEESAVLALPFDLTDMMPGQYLVREGEKVAHSCLLISGFAIRQKLARDGGRSISAVHMRGDIVDLQNSLLGQADHNVQALTKSSFAKIPRAAIIDLATRFPNLGLAMWYDTLVDASIFREWLLNISRRSAERRIAHLLCEFGVRLEALGLGDRSSYEVPMTQEQLADATGITPVHVNRCLRALEERALIARTARYVAVSDWAQMKEAGEFNEAYLHLDGSRPPHRTSAHWATTA